jgi:hypothetical protein
MGQSVEKQLQEAFIKQTDEIRLPPHPKPSISTLVFPIDASEPVILCRRSMMARFLCHRVLFVQQLPLPCDVQWHVVAAIYRGLVEDIILDVKRPVVVVDGPEETSEEW